jgi:hypothetical protein
LFQPPIRWSCDAVTSMWYTVLKILHVTVE